MRPLDHHCDSVHHLPFFCVFEFCFVLFDSTFHPLTDMDYVVSGLKRWGVWGARDSPPPDMSTALDVDYITDRIIGAWWGGCPGQGFGMWALGLRVPSTVAAIR